jgi:hypothetical protein
MKYFFGIFIAWNMFLSSPAFAEEWAAQATKGTIEGSVVWGASKEETTTKAIRSCNQKLEANGYEPHCKDENALTVSTDSNLFVNVCCRQNDNVLMCVGEAADTDGNVGRRDGYDKSIVTFKKFNMQTNTCNIYSVYSVKRGTKLPNWLN